MAKAGKGKPFPIPAPFKGLNTRDGFSILPREEARELENWLPDIGKCTVRPGHAEYQEVSGATEVTSLMTWRGASGTKLIGGASDGELYDVSGTPSALTTNSYSDNRWQTETFNGYLFGVNATDTPWRYDGSSVSATGFTGATLTDLETVAVYRERPWFTKKNSADVEYGGVASVTGALTTFQLSQIAAGGKCVGIGTWSRADAGDGPDDFIVFVMDTGEVIAYAGDPEDNFRIIGSYRAPAPVGINPTVKVGGELVIMTKSGPIPMTAIAAGNAFDPLKLDHWGKIAPSWTADFRLYGSNSGWSAFYFNGLVYFNVITGTNSSRQYVLNTRVPAWTIYTGLPVSMFSDYQGTLYFGSIDDGKVYSHTTGTDDGSDIITLVRQGFVYPTQGVQAARYTAMRPNINVDGILTGQFQLDTDFESAPISAHTATISSFGGGGEWDNADWDDAQWAATPNTRHKWRSTRGYGRAVAPVARTYSSADSVEWFATDVWAEPGGST